MVVLKALGLFDYLLEHGEKIDVLVGTNHKKKNVFVTRYSDFDEHSFGVGIHRSFLFDALYQACRAQANIQFILGRNVGTLKQLKQDHDLVIVALYAQRLRLTRFLSSHILCGKRVSWWRTKELDYDGGA